MIKKQELKAKNLVFDLVKSVQPQTDVPAFLKLSPKEWGLILVATTDGKSGVLLPDTK
jgi:dihydroorotate dehydrogenase